MLEELRLNPRSPGARSWGRSPGEPAATGSKKVKGRLSTGFAEGAGAESTDPFIGLGGLGAATEVMV
jgi:hypothetical protein